MTGPTRELSLPPAAGERSSARHGRRLRVPLVAVVGVVVVGVLALISLAVGSKDLSLDEVWRGLVAADASPASLIVWQLRMPRTVLAVVVGAALAVAGVLMQALTRNPLAEPGLLGVNAGAAFSVVVALTVFGATSTREYLWFALGGAGVASLFVYAVSVRRIPSRDHARLVLAGVALTASLGACTSIITMFDTDTFDSYRFWVIGSVADRGMEVTASILPVIAIALVVALAAGPSLNAVALGDEQATALGARLPAVRVVVLVAITLLCGAATAAAGPIAFVGLIVPHVLRLLVGVDHRNLLLLSVLVGPSLVLAADIIGRVIARPGEIEVGIVTAFLGAPVLIGLLLRRRVVR